MLSKCTVAEQESLSVSARLSSCTDGVMKEMSAVAEDGRTVLEEGGGYCSFLKSSLESLTDSSLQWCHAARDLTERRAEEQLSLAEENGVAAHKLLKVRRQLRSYTNKIWNLNNWCACRCASLHKQVKR